MSNPLITQKKENGAAAPGGRTSNRENTRASGGSTGATSALLRPRPIDHPEWGVPRSNERRGPGISSLRSPIAKLPFIAILLIELILVLPVYSAYALSIQNIQLKEFTPTSTAVEWITDKASNSTVRWGENSTTQLNRSVAESVTRHKLLMDTVSNKTYSFSVLSCDSTHACAFTETARFLAGPDTSPPIMNVTVPDVVNTNRLNLRVSTKPFSTVKVFIEGTLSRIANPSDTATGEVVFQNLILPKQENTLRLESVDQHGGRAELTIKVTVDPNPPILEIRDFPEYLQTPSFVLKGHVNKKSRIDIFVNPQNDVVPPGRVTGLKLTSVTPNQATLIWDPIQDQDLSEYGVIRDNKLIGVTRSNTFTDSTPSSGRNFNYRIQATDVNCNKGDMSDSIDVSVPSGGQSESPPPIIARYACESPTFTLQSDGDFTQQIPLISGTTTIKVVATDKAGNTATYTNTTIFDNIPPTFVETNLDALSPSYTPTVTIRGKVSEKATVLVFINNEQSPSAFATTNDDGTFSIPAKLRRDRRVGQTEAGTSPRDRRVGPIGDVTGEGFANTIKLQAVDIAKNTGDAGPVEVVLAQCGFGTGFSVDIGKPKPDVLNPRLILKNFGTVGFNVELKYLDSPETLDFLDRPNLLVRPVSLEDQPKFDLDLARSIRCSQDNTKCYVQITVRPPPGADSLNTTIQKENLISDHRKGECLVPGLGCYKIPLELEIRYQKKQPTGDLERQREVFGTLGPRIEPQTQRVCIPIEIGIDKRIDPKLLPNSLLKSSVQFFDAAIKSIDSILQPLQTIFNVVFYACYLGFTVGFFLDFSQRKSCEGAVLTGVLTDGAFNPEVAENGMCSAFYPEGDPRLEQARENCLRCQDSINTRKSTLQNMHQLCDRIFCPSAPSLQKYITDSQRKGVKHRTAPGPSGTSKEFFIGSDCASQFLKPNLYQGKDANEFGIDDIYQLYKVHKNDKPDGEKGVSIEALTSSGITLKRGDSSSGGTGGASTGASPTFGSSAGEPGKLRGDEPRIEISGTSKINCANQHPSTTECCGYEYQQTWGPVCSVMIPDFEITESRCLSAQQTGQGAVSGCKGFRQALNAIGGFCSRSGDVSHNLVATQVSYGRLTESENDPLFEIEKRKRGQQDEIAKRSGYDNIIESRAIFVSEEQKKENQQETNDAISGIYSGRGAESDITRGRIPDYVKDRRVYLKIVPQEGGAFIVQRGFVVEKAVLSDVPALDVSAGKAPEPDKQKTSLTETLDFVPDLDLTTYFQAPKEGGPLLYTAIESRWINALCSREAAAGASVPEGGIPRAGSGKTAMIGCSKKTAQDAWDEVRRKVGVGERDFIVNPAEDLTSSLKCGCLPGVTTHLKKWKGIMTAVRNCFNAVLVTGDGTPGACEAVLSRYICDFIYTLIKCFVQRYTAGYQRPETAGGPGLLGIGSIGSMLAKGGTSITQDLQSRYGGSPTYKAAFSEQKMVNSICLFAFTGTFNLKPELLAESEISNIPVDSQPFTFPCERRFIQFDVASNPPGLATWNYHIGADLFAGADLTWALKLKCSSGFDCDPTDGFQNGQCDCAKTGEKTLTMASGNLKQFESIGERGEVFENVQQRGRFDRAILEWQYRDKDGRAKTGTQECKIETIGGDAPVFCAFDILEDSFRCSTDIFSEFFAKFSNTPVPNFPDPLAQIFKLDDDVAFSVPIVQRIPEGAACAGGRSCTATKYLVYTIKNTQGTVIATNDQTTFDPSSSGSDATADVSSFVDIDAENILNTQGERIYTIRLGQLKEDHFNIVAGSRRGGVTAFSVEPDTFKEFITVQRETGATPADFDLLFDITDPSTAAQFIAFRADGNKRGASVDSGAVSNARIRSQGYIITLTNPAKITEKKLSVFIPRAASASTLVEKRCDRTRPSETTETWSATFEIRDADQQQLGSFNAGNQVAVVNGKAQRQTITFKTLCNTGLPLGKQRGECTENRQAALNCHCYPSREQTADKIASGSKGNCATSTSRREACVDGTCVNVADTKLCAPSETVDSDHANCLCGFDGGTEKRCAAGETCIINPNGANTCGKAISGGGTVGTSIRFDPSTAVTTNQLLTELNRFRPGDSANPGLAESFLRHGRDNGIDPAFLVGVTVAESGINSNSNFPECNNMFNIEVRSPQTPCPRKPRFGKYNSLDENIADAARLLANNYITKGQDTIDSIGGPISLCSDPTIRDTFPCCTKGSSGSSHCYCCDGGESTFRGWKTNIDTSRTRIHQNPA